MTFQVLILLLLFRVCDGHSASKAFHHLSQVAVLKVAEWKLLVVPLPPYAFFFFFFCSSKQKYAGLGTLQVVRFPLRGGVKGLGVGCVCSGVSPSI